MLWLRCTVGILAIIASLGFARHAQGKIDLRQPMGLEEELLYFPNEKVLNHFTGGLSSVAADILWLRTVKYTVAEFHNPERKFIWLEHMCNAVVDLDPHFEDAYVYGSMFMASIGSDRRAMKLLERGMPENPYSWKIPFEMAKIHILNRRDDPASHALAIHYLGMVAERSDEPEFFLDWIDGLQETHSLAGEARKIWENISRTAESEFVRELADSKLRELNIQTNLSAMQGAANLYEDELGVRPALLTDLVKAGYLPSLPENQAHGTYYLDENGAVLNTLDIEIRSFEIINFLSGQIKAFTRDPGGYPESLETLEQWMGEKIPSHPDPTRSWNYDPSTGGIS